DGRQLFLGAEEGHGGLGARPPSPRGGEGDGGGGERLAIEHLEQRPLVRRRALEEPVTRGPAGTGVDLGQAGEKALPLRGRKELRQHGVDEAVHARGTGARRVGFGENVLRHGGHELDLGSAECAGRPRAVGHASGGRVAAARHPVEGKRRAWPSSRRHPTITYSGSVPVIAVTGKGTALAVPRGTGIPSTGRIDVKRPTAVTPRGLCLSLFVPL